MDLVRLRGFLLDTSRDVPLPILLTALRLLRRLVPVAHLPIARARADVFGLHGAELRDACQRSWWCSKSSDVLSLRLDVRAEDVFALVNAPDFSPIERARQSGRGVILAAAHVGPAQVGASLIQRQFPDAIFLRRDAPWRGPGKPRLLLIEEPATRAPALAEALAHLRRGGIVHVAPDGRSIDHTVDVPLRDGVRPMGHGIAALARLGRARSFPFGVGWAGNRLQVLIGDEIAPRPGAAPEAQDLAWLTEYVACVDRWSTLVPENLPAIGGLYEWFERRTPG